MGLSWKESSLRAKGERSKIPRNQLKGRGQGVGKVVKKADRLKGVKAQWDEVRQVRADLLQEIDRLEDRKAHYYRHQKFYDDFEPWMLQHTRERVKELRTKYDTLLAKFKATHDWVDIDDWR